MRRALLSAFSVLIHSAAQASPDQLAALADSAQWRALLHCHSLEPGRCDSRISDTGYFLAPNGSEDPAAELTATIAAFTTGGVSPESPLCRFPARREWIAQVLPEVASRFPAVTCPEQDEWMALIAPHAATLIFPSSFINNPASAFGHTLLRIDQPDQNEQTRLLAYSANFAANTQGEDALTYAMKGVFGGYQGYFSVAPYYQKVKTYSDLENRDIWEYTLNLTPVEVRRMALHLWELRRVAFKYYYFDENCSYQLLSLLEVARPTLRLSARFPVWVIPSDTVRALIEVPGLVSARVFRPSLATKLHARVDGSSGPTTALGLLLADPSQSIPSLTELSPEQQASALALGYEILTYRRVLERTDATTDRERAYALLAARAKITAADPVTAEPVPPSAPELGHGTARVSVAAGRSEGKWFSEYDLRPAFHDQIDPEDGYLRGAQIRFFQTQLRHYTGDQLRLQRFQLLNLESISPRSEVFHPISWNVRLESVREHSDLGGEQLTKKLGGGPGLAWEPVDAATVYAFLDGELSRRDDTRSAWSFGIGPRIGAIVRFDDRYALVADARARRTEIGDRYTTILGEVSARAVMSESVALRVGVTGERTMNRDASTAFFSLDYFFTPVRPSPEGDEASAR